MRRAVRQALRGSVWACALVLGTAGIVFAQTWFAWQRQPVAYGGTANALWARHQWAARPHTEAEYLALASELTRDRITDVFFHVGPPARRIDQVAIMTYDSEAPTQTLAGRHFARHTERVLSLIGDRVTVFMGVPTYRTPTPWAEDLPVALRGVRQGIDALGRRPRRPYGIAVYADWTTTARDWATFRRDWNGAGS